MNNFTSNLKYLRIINHLNQKELARRLKVSPSTLLRWERSDNGITMDNLETISNYFNISVTDLISRDLSKEKIIENISDGDKTAILFNTNKQLLTDSDKLLIETIINNRIEEQNK